MSRKNNWEFVLLFLWYVIFTCGLCVIGFMISGCANERNCQKFIKPSGADTVIMDSIVERVRDTIIYTDIDSSSLTALLECEGEKVRLVEILHYTTGKLAKIPKIKVINNVAYVKCQVDSLQVYFRWREKDVFRSIKTAQVYVKITNILNWWQTLWVWTGRILGGLVLLYFLLIFAKRFIKF